MAAGGSAGVVSTKGQQLAQLTGSTDHSGGLVAGQGLCQCLHQPMGKLRCQGRAIDTSTLQVGYQLPVSLAGDALALAATHPPVISQIRHYSRG
jgi:hypothetical protein